MILSAKRLITGDGKTVLTDSAVLVNGGVIMEIGAKDKLAAAYPGEEVRDYGDATLLPGLIDMHAHIGYWAHGAEGRNDYLIGFNALKYARTALETGVTTLRDVSGPDGAAQSLIDADKRGFVNVGRILHSNVAVCATGGHGWQNGCEADGEQEIRKAIRLQIRKGAKWIKIMTSHRSPGVSEYTQEELNAAVDEAHRHQRKVSVHSSIQPSLELCINAGVDTIEHGCELTEEQAKRMIEKNIALVATLLVHKSAYDKIQAIIDAGGADTLTAHQRDTYRIYGLSNSLFRQNFKKFADWGMTMCAGTDMISADAHPAPVADELAVMVEYGFDPLRAIASGTSVNAKVLEMEGQIGILAEGAQADILVVDGDPGKNIKDLKKVKAVYFGGEIVNRWA